MHEKSTPETVRRAVISAVAKIQCRSEDYYEGKPGMVISSCDIAAMLPTLEQSLGCEPFLPNDFAPTNAGGQGGLCYDPIEDLPIEEIYERVAKRATTVGRGAD